MRNAKNKDSALEKKCWPSVRISSTMHYIEKCIILHPGAYGYYFTLRGKMKNPKPFYSSAKHAQSDTRIWFGYD